MQIGVGAKRSQLRLEVAAQMLNKQPAASITDIALDCGFSTSQNFTTAFRKQYGGSPRQFRRDN